jgi:PAS domain S-box-containing protein
LDVVLGRERFLVDRQGERVTAEEDDRYRLLVESITDYAIYMLDTDGRITSWNPGARRSKGYETQEILGRHFSTFYTEEDRTAGLPAKALRTAAEEGRFENEGWRLRKDGSRFRAHVIVDPIRSPSGELIGFAKITRDLTERQAAQERIRQSEEQFRLLVQSVTDYAIFMLDRSGRISSWNAGAQRIKGYRADEIIGEHFSRFYTEEDRAAGLPSEALRIAEFEGRFEREGWRLRKDGDRFWAHVVIDPIRDDAGEIIGFAKVTRDITERTEARRTLEQARESLLQAQKLDAIGRLTGGVAHDFNNLLMAILGSLEMVRKRLPHDKRITPLINNAIQGAERGAALTQRMLAFARKQELKMSAVELPALIRGMIGLLQTSLGPSIRVEARFPRNLPPLHTDAHQLEAALLNLAVNARDAMPAGGVIEITAAVESISATPGGLPAGDYVRLSVTDSGEGMDPETAARAAEPFFTTKGVGKGTGLGLSMVQGLAAQSGGRMEISTRPGAGTTIHLVLPVGEEVEERLVFTGERRDEAELDVAPLNILAVDDDQLVLMNTVAMLEDLGHRVHAADSGDAALKILGREAIDLVLTDFAMPAMTGIQLAAEVSALRPDTPIILATGYAELPPGDAAGLPRLAKPFLLADLARAIGRASSEVVAD